MYLDVCTYVVHFTDVLEAFYSVFYAFTLVTACSDCWLWTVGLGTLAMAKLKRRGLQVLEAHGGQWEGEAGKQRIC